MLQENKESKEMYACMSVLLLVNVQGMNEYVWMKTKLGDYHHKLESYLKHYVSLVNHFYIN